MSAAIMALGPALVLAVAPAAPGAERTVADWVASSGGRVERDGRGRITAVVLRGTWITDAALARLQALPTVERLDLSHTRVSDRGLLGLAELPRVRELDLSWAEQITDAGIAYLKGWRHLRRLGLRGTKITDTALGLLPHWPALEALDVAFARITDAGVPRLAAARNLRALALGGNKLGEEPLQVLAGLSRLVSLDLSGQQRTDSGLWSVRMGDALLAAIGSLRALEVLNLGGAQCSRRGLERLASLPRLHTLDLHGARGLDAAAIAPLGRLRPARWIDLADTGIPPETLDQLRRALPAATVLP